MAGYFEKEWTLNFTQCYANGQLKYSELNNILQITASEHAVILGFGARTMLKHKQSWVLSRMLIQIKRLPRFEQTLTIRTWIQDFSGSRSTRNFEVILGEHIVATASSLWAVFNVEARKAEALAVSTEHAVIIPDKHSTSRPVQRIEGLCDFQKLKDYQVVLSDLDIAGHANNVKYMEWCFDALDPKYVLSQQITEIEMNFLRELTYGNQVSIHKGVGAQGSDTYNISRNEKIHFLMHVANKQD